MLFEGSVQENISLTRPDATFEEIVDAAKVACAHEFIENLSGGYSSSVGEREALYLVAKDKGWQLQE